MECLRTFLKILLHLPVVLFYDSLHAFQPQAVLPLVGFLCQHPARFI